MNKFYIILFIVIVCGREHVLAQDSLDVYLQTAFENSPAVLSSYQSFAAMLSQTDQAGILPDPTLAMAYFISPVETRVGPQRMRFSLSQMFPWFGTLEAKRNQMSKQAEASYWQYANSVRMIVRDVRSAYYDLWVAHRMVQVEEENLALIQSFESLATTRFRSGEGRLAQVLRVQLDKKSAMNSLEKQRQLYETKKRQFFLLLNAPADSVYMPDSVIVNVPFLSPADSINGHPLVQSNLARSEAAVSYAEVARKQGYPTMGVGLDYIIISKRDDMVMSDNGKNAFAPMVTIGLPVWRRKYKAMKEEAYAMERQYQLSAESEQNRLMSALAEAEYAIQRALADLQLYEEQISLAQRMLSLTRTDFASDQASFDDILDDQDQLLNYRRARLISYGALLKNVASYDYLVGDNPYLTEEFDYEKDK